MTPIPRKATRGVAVSFVPAVFVSSLISDESDTSRDGCPPSDHTNLSDKLTNMSTLEPTWTVLTWNLQGSKHTDLDRVAEIVRGESPDLVLLQEVRRPQARTLARSLEMQKCWALKHNPYRPFLSGRAEGAAILTPHELTDTDHTVISEASSTRSYTRRIVLWATVTRTDQSAYRVFDAHLSPHDMTTERLVEAQRLSALAAQMGDVPPIIVAGDFNNHGEPEVVAALPGIEIAPAPATNPSESPNQQLDHVLVPTGSTLADMSVPEGDESWAELSDHLPLIVRFSLARFDPESST